MYKKTDPQQSLFGVETQLSKSLRTRLKDSWAQLFRVEVLPILLKSEDTFAILYGTTGRPNFSVARMLGWCFRQELSNLSDQQALDTFGFDIRWRYALYASDQDAYISRRSLVEFRRRLAAKDPEMMIVRTIFEKISKAAIKKLGISISEQRVDSTHIVSNIFTRGRLECIKISGIRWVRFFIQFRACTACPFPLDKTVQALVRCGVRKKQERCCLKRDFPTSGLSSFHTISKLFLYHEKRC